MPGLAMLDYTLMMFIINLLTFSMMIDIIVAFVLAAVGEKTVPKHSEPT